MVGRVVEDSLGVVVVWGRVRGLWSWAVCQGWRVKGHGWGVFVFIAGGGKVAENVAIVPYFLIILLRAT